MADVKISLGYDLNELRADEAKVVALGKQTGAKAAAAMAAGSREAGGGGNSALMKMAGEAWAASGGINALRSTFDYFDRLNDLAVRFDTDAESMQRLAAMAKMSGTDVEALAKAEQKLMINLESAEEDPKLAKALRTLGLETRALRAAAPEERIKLLRDGFEQAQGKGEGFADVFALMGKNAGELIPLLRSSREEMEDMASVKILSNDDVARIAEFNDTVDRLKMNMMGMVSVVISAADSIAAMSYALSSDSPVKGFAEAKKYQEEMREEAVKEAEARKRQKAEEREIAAAKAHQAAIDAARRKDKEDQGKINAVHATINALGTELSLTEKIQQATDALAEAKRAEHEAIATDTKTKGEVELEAVKRQLEAQQQLMKLKKEQTTLDNDVAQARITEMKEHGRSPAAARAQRQLDLKKEEERLTNMGMTPEAAKAEAARRQRSHERAGTVVSAAATAAGAAWGLDAHGPSALDAARKRNAIPWADTHPGLGLMAHRGPAGAHAAAANARDAAAKPDPTPAVMVDRLERIEKAIERLGA